MTSQSEQVTKYATLQLTIDQVELLLDLPEDSIPDSEELSRAYRKGRASGLARIRATLLKEVDNGNVTAAKLMNEYAASSEPDYVED